MQNVPARRRHLVLPKVMASNRTKDYELQTINY